MGHDTRGNRLIALEGPFDKGCAGQQPQAADCCEDVHTTTLDPGPACAPFHRSIALIALTVP